MLQSKIVDISWEQVTTLTEFSVRFDIQRCCSLGCDSCCQVFASACSVTVKAYQNQWKVLQKITTAVVRQEKVGLRRSYKTPGPDN